MPAKPAKKQPKAPTDVVLAYVGPGPFSGVPARDLSAGDLARLAYRRALASSGADGIRPDPRDPDPALIKAITAELTGSGLYELEG